MLAQFLAGDWLHFYMRRWQSSWIFSTPLERLGLMSIAMLLYQFPSASLLKQLIVPSSVFSLQCLQRTFHSNLEVQKNSVKLGSSARDKQNSTYFVSGASYCSILGHQRHQANRTLTLDTPWLRFRSSEHISKHLLWFIDILYLIS